MARDNNIGQLRGRITKGRAATTDTSTADTPTTATSSSTVHHNIFAVFSTTFFTVRL